MNAATIHIIDRSGHRCMRCGERLPLEVAGQHDMTWCGIARAREGEGVRIWPPEQLVEKEGLARAGYQLCRASDETV